MKLKIYFPTRDECSFHHEGNLYKKIKRELLFNSTQCEETLLPEVADAFIIQEESSFKEWRYIKKIKENNLIGPNLHKTYTINNADAAAGLFKGIYTSLAKNRFNPNIHGAIPFDVQNVKVLEFITKDRQEPRFSASWRGNITSNALRSKIFALHKKNTDFYLEESDRWFDYKENEKDRYVDIMRSSLFSLCPAGWAPATIRLYESMALGISPIIIADKFVLPIGPDWSSIALVIKESDINKIPEIVTKNLDRAVQMGSNAQAAWRKYFSNKTLPQYCANLLLDIITKRIGADTIGSEYRRWNSWSLWISNDWTIAQRLMNRVRRL